MHGGSVAVVNNRLFYFGGLNAYDEISTSAYEYIPYIYGREFNQASNRKDEILSYWKEHPNVIPENLFMVTTSFKL